MRKSSPTTDVPTLPLAAPAATLHRDRTVFRISGKDPRSLLDAVLTRDVPPGESFTLYALLLDPKGRVLTDLTVVPDGPDLLAVTEAEGAENAAAALGRYAPFSRVTVEREDLAVLGVYGPGSHALFGLDREVAQCRKLTLGEVAATACALPMEPPEGAGLLVPRELVDSALEAVLALGAGRLSAEAYETVRVHSASPRYGADVTTGNFPAEAHLDRSAVSFEKGCYPGQETVARMHYRGQPNKRLYRFVVSGEAAPSAAIVQEGREVGLLTSVAPLPVGDAYFALGYLKRKADPEGPLRAGEAELRVF